MDSRNIYSISGYVSIGVMMMIKWILTADMPVYAVGLWDSKKEAQAFADDNRLENLVPTPLFIGE